MRVEDAWSGPVPLASYVENRMYGPSRRDSRSEAAVETAENTAQAFGRLIEVLARKEILAINEVAFIVDCTNLRIVE